MPGASEGGDATFHQRAMVRYCKAHHVLRAFCSAQMAQKQSVHSVLDDGCVSEANSRFESPAWLAFAACSRAADVSAAPLRWSGRRVAVRVVAATSRRPLRSQADALALLGAPVRASLAAVEAAARARRFFLLIILTMTSRSEWPQSTIQNCLRARRAPAARIHDPLH